MMVSYELHERNARGAEGCTEEAESWGRERIMKMKMRVGVTQTHDVLQGGDEAQEEAGLRT